MLTAIQVKRSSLWRWMCALLLVAGLMAALPWNAQAATAPTISIVSVVVDESVTIKTANFPANNTFTFRMGDYGNYAIGGYIVGTLESGSGGAITATYPIPAELKGKKNIAIRADGKLGYFAYSWFVNNTTGTVVTPVPQTTPIPGYKGYPTFSIFSVAVDTSVTIETKNLPPNQTFTVRIGKYGTYGKGGTEVGTFASESGAVQKLTFNIPEGLKGSSMLSIRFDSPAGYYAYNWFTNKSGEVVTTPVPPSGYKGYPTFTIKSVVKDTSVIITTKNLPAGQTFTVKMGKYGAYGVGGTEVATFESGEGGVKELTFNIPAGLKGNDKVAIRMDSNSGYFAYNWFYNH